MGQETGQESSGEMVVNYAPSESRWLVATEPERHCTPTESGILPNAFGTRRYHEGY
jgi:hypothetical protein